MARNPADAFAAARRDLEAWRGEADVNRFDADPFFVGLSRRFLGEAEAERLRQVAELAGQALDDAVAASNHDDNLPVVRRHDGLGRRVEEVVFHPAYHEVGRSFWSSGVLAALTEPGNDTLCGAIAYLLDQHGEAGHACPVACTAGAIKLVQRLGTDDQRRRYLPRLLSADYDDRLHAAQLVTEVQGGSDVGRNACVAEPAGDRPGWYRISGEKWFCSVADAGLFVVSARPTGAAPGTRGLGLFLVPRTVDGAPNGFALRRLKTKLGTRSMATGEIDFDGALGEAVGPLEEGFKHLVGIVLDTSRVHNALAACGIMRRAVVEATAFAHRRQAFDHAVADFPAAQEILARMQVRSMACLASTFRVLELSDLLERGNAGQVKVSARRIAVMVNKYWTAIAATRTVRDAIEMLGGNGTIEDFSVLPRLYRDAIVVESWEGTHNTLCAQVLRDFVVRDMDRPWLEIVTGEVEALQGAAGETARDLLGRVEAGLLALHRADGLTGSAIVRHLVDRMCRLTDWVALAAQARWEEEHDWPGQTVRALELYRLTFLRGASPLDSAELIDLNRELAGGGARYGCHAARQSAGNGAHLTVSQARGPR